MTSRKLVNGVENALVAASDRGVLYGDGLFETILFVRGVAPLWARHMARLALGCERLLFPAPDAQALAREAAQVVEGMPRAVVRITLTRGSGARGYALPDAVMPTRIVAAFDPPFIPADWYARGIRVRFGELRLSSQPRLAGIKHLNRLEQVLARAEWSDPDIVEALLFDERDHLIGATAANVFMVRGGRLVTPKLDLCGVAGVAREEILARHPDTEVREIGREELMQADEIFLSSSVRGILPVRELDGRAFAPGPFARALQAHWRTLAPLPEREA
ncbi:MAG TPA: aminodeoxychorismate lyase [Rhodanobacteraceae bacterium]|nr:aminodeoxychorismate lyase [Rhodanobacteraceae bacterium]